MFITYICILCSRISVGIKNKCKRLNLQAVRRNTRGGFTTEWSNTHHYFVCLTPKVAHTSLRTYLKKFGNTTKCVIKNTLTEVVRCKKSKEKLHLQNYYKFMFVRDPLDRLFSAFYDKMIRRAPVTKRLYAYLVNLLKKKRRNSTHHPQGENNNLLGLCK